MKQEKEQQQNEAGEFVKSWFAKIKGGERCLGMGRMHILQYYLEHQQKRENFSCEVDKKDIKDPIAEGKDLLFSRGKLRTSFSILNADSVKTALHSMDIQYNQKPHATNMLMVEFDKENTEKLSREQKNWYQAQLNAKKSAISI